MRRALGFMGAGPLARSVCPVASNPVGDLVHAGFELPEFVWREAGSRHGAWTPEGGLMLAMFQIPNKFYERDGRVTDVTGQDWETLAPATAERVVAGGRRSRSRGCGSPRRGGGR
jgi:hypothetical protein